MKTVSDPEFVNTGKSWQDLLILARESILDWITGVSLSPVLNKEHLDHPQFRGRDLAVQMREALDRIKADVMDTHGNLVDYAALRTHPAYLDYRKKLSPSLRVFDPGSLKPGSERMAFWINLYHALVLEAVISFGIKQSVAEGRLGLLSFFRRAAYQIGGLRLSLNDIEHGILRGNTGYPFVPGPHFGSSDPRRAWVFYQPDPRIHFALNCASNSCPPIRVYLADKLDAQLDVATRSFLDADVRMNPIRKILTVSSIFRWYEGDFGGREGLISFLLIHLPRDERRLWLSDYRELVRLNYKPYDWSLNVSS